MISRRLSVAIGTATALAVVLAAGMPAAYAHGSHGYGAGYGGDEAAVVSLESSPYGPVLVVGGPGAGYVPANPGAKPPTPATYIYPAGSSLYFPSIDPRAHKGWFGEPYEAGCLTIEVPETAFGTLSCTGLGLDEHADWPALTTARKPIAGPGVDPRLLGSVYRADLGTFQVTYAGHTLYLFNPGANLFTGEKLPETVLPLPPWHTYWFLLSPDGLPATGPAHVETEAPQAGTTYSSTVLATEMAPEAPEIPPGGVAVSVYSFSRDSHWRSHCVGPCAREFVPVLTDGAPTAGPGVSAGGLGEIVRHHGSHQVTYDGHPLYLYSQEQPLVGETGLITTGAAGNGNGIHAFGGTFTLVSP